MEAEDHYAQVFERILNFNENSFLTDLLDPAQKNNPSQTPERIKKVFNGIFSKFIQTETKHFVTEENQKKLILQLDEWSEYLLSELEENRDNKFRIKELRKIANRIFKNKFDEQIRQKLHEQNIENQLLLKAVYRINKRVMSILSFSEPSLKKSEWSYLAKIQILGALNKHTLFPLLSFPKELNSTKFIDRNLLQIAEGAKKKELLLEKLAERFDKLHTMNKINQSKILLQEFGFLEEYDEICLVADLLQPLQILEIIKHGVVSHSFNKQLPPFVFSLSYSQLFTVLDEFEENSLLTLSQIFKGSHFTTSAIFKELFNKQCQGFVDAINEATQKIDFLAAKFRHEIHPWEIQKSDICQILTLKDIIEKNLEIAKKYRMIIKDIVDDSESLKLMIGYENDAAEIFTEYETQLKRLGESEQEMDKVSGCPFGIIHRKVFEDEGCYDDDEAYEILGSWNIYSLNDWRDAGLFGSISHTDFNHFQDQLKKNQEGIGFKYGKKVLESLDIRYIHDWKRLHIYNKTLLQEYLKRPEIRKQIKSVLEQPIIN